MLCFFCFARFKASHAHCFIHWNWGLWLLAANTKYSKHAGLSCGRILQESCCCDHQIHLSRWNRSRSFLEKCLVLLYGTALWISERWHRQPLKRALSGLKTRRRVAVVHQRISRSFFVTSVSWMFASFCVHIQLLWLHVCIPGCRILEYAECMNGCRIQTGWSLCCFFTVTAFTGAEVFPCYRSVLPTLRCSFLLGHAAMGIAWACFGIRDLWIWCCRVSDSAEESVFYLWTTWGESAVVQLQHVTRLGMIVIQQAV